MHGDLHVLHGGCRGRSLQASKFGISFPLPIDSIALPPPSQLVGGTHKDTAEVPSDKDDERCANVEGRAGRASLLVDRLLRGGPVLLGVGALYA